MLISFNFKGAAFFTISGLLFLNLSNSRGLKIIIIPVKLQELACWKIGILILNTSNSRCLKSKKKSRFIFNRVEFRTVKNIFFQFSQF